MKRCEQDKVKIKELQAKYASSSSDMSITADQLKKIKKEIQEIKSQPKYELIKAGELFQIRSKVDFGNIKANTLGGLVEGHHNLSHKGTCWIFPNAIVKEKARVIASAIVKDNAVVSGCAFVYGKAIVENSATVTDDAMIYGKAKVTQNASITGNAHIRGKAVVSGSTKVGGQIIISSIEVNSKEFITGTNMKKIKSA